MGDDARLSRWMEAYLKAWHYMSALPGEIALQGLLALAVRVGCDLEGDGSLQAEVSGSGLLRPLGCRFPPHCKG